MKNLKILRLERNLTQAELGKRINSTQRQISKWELGVIEPGISDLEKLSDYFNVSIDYLVGRESEDGTIIKDAPALSPDEQELLNGFRQLTPAMKGRILGNLQGLLQARELTTISEKHKL